MSKTKDYWLKVGRRQFDGWCKHLRPYSRRVAWKKTRQAQAKELRRGDHE